MRNTKLTKLVGAAAAALMALTGCGGLAGEGGDSITLKYATFLAEDHPYSQYYLSWAEEVTEKTDGRIKFQNFWSDSLVPSYELAAAAEDGRVDLANPNTNYTPERFPLSEAVSVPFLTPDPAAALAATMELYETYEPYRMEFEDDGVIPLHWQPTGTNVIGSTKPLTTIDELQGASVRSASYYAEGMGELGANPITMPLGDVYQSVDTGVVDAWMTPMENAVQFSLAEVTPYMQDPGMGPTSLSIILMNKDTFDGLLPDDQQVLLDTSADYNERWVEDLLLPVDEGTCEGLAEFEVTYHVWDEAEQEKAREQIGEHMTESFIEDANGYGAPAEEFLQKWSEITENYDGKYGEYPGSVQTCITAG